MLNMSIWQTCFYLNLGCVHWASNIRKQTKTGEGMTWTSPIRNAFLFPLQIVLKRVRLYAILNTTLATLCLPPLSRNYHVFYYLLAGASEEERKAFHLLKPEEYHYLNQVGSPHTHTHGIRM